MLLLFLQQLYLLLNIFNRIVDTFRLEVSLSVSFWLIYSANVEIVSPVSWCLCMLQSAVCLQNDPSRMDVSCSLYQSSFFVQRLFDVPKSSWLFTC